MDIERKKRTALNISTFFDAFNIKWFLCFGTLLSFVRDKKFNLNTDIDIGVVGPIDNLKRQISNQYQIQHYIKSDNTGKILNFTYIDTNNSSTIDVFSWVEFKGMYWHTYDTMMEFPSNGILSKYVFKSMPKNVFDVDKKKIKSYQEKLAFGRAMTDHGTWKHVLHELPAEGIELSLPYNYGYFLDIAYPDWATTREQFGVSLGYSEMKVDSCKGLC